MGRIYATETQDRFYDIPDDAALATGPLRLRSLSGARLEVNAEDADAHRITEAEAKLRVKDELRAFTKKAAGAVSGIGRVLRNVTAPVHTDVPASKTSPSVLAETLGVTPDQLRGDPSAVKAGLEDVLSGLMETVRDALKDSPEAREQTRERMGTLVSALGDAAPSEEAMTRATDGLRSLLADPALEAGIRDATAKLSEVTARMKTSGEALLRDLDGSDE